MKGVIFLDIDGVLNRHEWNVQSQSSPILPECVDLLNEILVKTETSIVLSSAWRYMILKGAMTLEGFGHLLRSHGVLTGRLIGHTCGDEEAGPIRGKQITQWLKKHKHNQPYLVIDDLDLGITDEGHPCVFTEPHVGLTREKADEILSLLTQKETR